MIGLKKWLDEHRVPKGHIFKHRGKTIEVNGLHYDYHKDSKLNDLQLKHMSGDINLYEPIEAYSQAWDHDNKAQTWAAKEGTRKRNDLPPVYMQWKQAYKYTS